MDLRILALSDIHGDERFREHVDRVLSSGDKVDCIVVAGDITHGGPARIAERILGYLRSLNVPVLAVPGNLDPQSSIHVAFRKTGIVDLHGRGEILDGIGFIGCGGSPIGPHIVPYRRERYYITEEEIARTLLEALEDLERKGEKPERIVLVTHTPPYGTKLDVIFGGGHAGSRSVRVFVEELQPDLVICGHMHESRGIDRIGRSLIVNVGESWKGYLALIDLGESIRIKLLEPKFPRSKLDRLRLFPILRTSPVLVRVPMGANSVLKEIMDLPLYMERAIALEVGKIREVARLIARGEYKPSIRGYGSGEIVGRYLEKILDLLGVGVERMIDRSNMLLAISITGSESELSRDLRLAGDLGIVRIAISPREDSRISEQAEISISAHSGPELGPSIKTIQSECALCSSLGAELARELGSKNQRVDGGSIAYAIDSLRSNLPEWSLQANTLSQLMVEKERGNLLIVGDSFDEISADLSATILRIFTGKPIISSNSRKLKYQLLDLLGSDSILFLISTDPNLEERSEKILEVAKDLGSSTIAIGYQSSVADLYLPVDLGSSWLSPLISPVPFYLLGFYASLRLGRSPLTGRSRARRLADMLPD